jgi:NTP pyrophosphatase (non-canonical NTP hydrolase)
MIAREDIEAINNLIDSTPTEYSDFVESMIVTKPEDRLMENLLGLCEEVGELHGKIKRVLRDNTNDEEGILKECGDVLFYTVAIANYFDSDLQDIIQRNMYKLNSRAARGVIKGSGDNR